MLILKTYVTIYYVVFFHIETVENANIRKC